MVNMKQPPAWDDPLYHDIRHVAGDLAYVCDEVTFGPLHGRHVKVLSVNGVIPGFGESEVNLTLWKGPRDGTGKDGSLPGWWIQNGDRDADTVPFDPEERIVGLDCPEDLKDKVGLAVPILYKLLVLAEKAHAGLVGLARVRSFRQLNDAVDVGMSAARADGGGYEEDEYDELSSVEQLQEACAESVFQFIDFDSLPPDTDALATSGVFLISDLPVSMSVWSGHDRGSEVTYMAIGGRTQRLPREGSNDPEVQWPDEDEEVNLQIADACEELLGIHHAAETVFNEVKSRDLETVRSLLSAAAQASFEDADGDDHEAEVGAAWHNQLQEFTRQCRLGLLVGVVVDESPHGPGLNVRAETLDPVTRQPVRLQVFWKAPEHPEDKPVHWLATDLAETPAHRGDPLHPELLAGFAQDSRLHIRHAIDHLHDIADLATEVVAAREMEMSAMLERAGMEGHVPDLVGGDMIAESIEDAMAALNGIARLYTGSRDRDVRNS